MCRNIHTLFNYEPPATEAEVRDASLQYVRKISGDTSPSQATQWLLTGLVTKASPKDREVEAERRRARAAKRFAAA